MKDSTPIHRVVSNTTIKTCADGTMDPRVREDDISCTITTTVDEREINHFSAHADAWWDETGAFRILHRMNPLRLQFIIENLKQEIFTDPSSEKIKNSSPTSSSRKRGSISKPHDESPISLKNMDILDVGCGGGLICEPLARLGASVTGIDATPENILVAQKHAKVMGLDINYQATTAEDLAAQGKQFDVVIAYEVIEHVSNPEGFLRALTALVKPEGHLFLSTLNRTPQSYLFGILAAEYVLGWAPRGTHTWRKFISPSELSHLLRLCGFSSRAVQGLNFSPLTRTWYLSHDVAMNYLVYARQIGPNI